jgi:hypothetical protein
MMVPRRLFIEKMKKIFTRALFPVIGLVATIWFLIRVIPKPSRASYPCMRVAFPLASTFVTYILSLGLSWFAFKQMRTYVKKNRCRLAAIFMLTGLVSGVWFLSHSDISLAGNSITYTTSYPVNEPMGTGVGIFPGRVVWAWNPDATNENQTGTDDGEIEISENDDYYFLIKNNDQTVIDEMTDDVVLNLTGEATVGDAWHALFRFHNMKESGKDSTYKPGEKIFIKTNATSITQGEGGYTWSTWEPTELTKYKATWHDNPDIVETTPQVVLSVLRQLINEAGVLQEDIYVGDPMKNVYKHLFVYWKADFPDINVLGNDMFYTGLDLPALDRVPVEPTENDVIFYSDKGAQMDGAISDKLYTIHEEADYLINIAALKAHACAGITLCAKNHFGSQSRASAQHLHKGIICEENDKPLRSEYGMYRVQVDLMAHKMLGGNTVLFMVDGLYSALEGWTDAYPVKWEMAPFNNDFTNSIFASLDPVAIEAVCFDLLRTEYDGPSVEYNRPNMAGVDDYLIQAADPANWAEGITYDPEDDGIAIGSLGVYEHWNNEIDMQYSRDMGEEEGIELVKIFKTGTAIDRAEMGESADRFQLFYNYPNPFNNSTVISYGINKVSHVSLVIYDLSGKKVKTLQHGRQNSGIYSVRWDGTDQSSVPVASGIYIYTLSATSEGRTINQSKRMLLIK